MWLTTRRRPRRETPTITIRSSSIECFRVLDRQRKRICKHLSSLFEGDAVFRQIRSRFFWIPVELRFHAHLEANGMPETKTGIIEGSKNGEGRPCQFLLVQPASRMEDSAIRVPKPSRPLSA